MIQETHNAWHYNVATSDELATGELRVTQGTITGEGLETREQAIAEVARQHHAKPEDVRVRRAGK